MQVSITVNGDTLDESNESFFVRLREPGRAVILYFHGNGGNDYVEGNGGSDSSNEPASTDLHDDRRGIRMLPHVHQGLLRDPIENHSGRAHGLVIEIVPQFVLDPCIEGELFEVETKGGGEAFLVQSRRAKFEDHLPETLDGRSHPVLEMLQG